MSKEYILYSTSACHLCELAEAMIKLVKKNNDINYILLDIAENDYLFEAFGLIIPVLKCLETKEQLNWPFNEDLIIEFINRQKKAG